MERCGEWEKGWVGRREVGEIEGESERESKQVKDPAGPARLGMPGTTGTLGAPGGACSACGAGREKEPARAGKEPGRA